MSLLDVEYLFDFNKCTFKKLQHATIRVMAGLQILIHGHCTRFLHQSRSFFYEPPIILCLIESGHVSSFSRLHIYVYALYYIHYTIYTITVCYYINVRVFHKTDWYELLTLETVSL